MSKPCKKSLKIPIWQRLANRTPAIRYKITHCIFDLDGTLINSEDVHQHAIREILAKYKLEYRPELQSCTLGRSAEDVCKILVTDGEVPLSLDKCIKLFEEKTSKKFAKCKLMPGVEKLLMHLYKHHVPCALATTSTEEEIDLKLSAFGDIRLMFHHEVAGGTDSKVRKNPPFPDLLFASAERFCTYWENRKILVFDDAPIGVRAANAAGMKIVLVQQMEMPQCVTKCVNVAIPTLDEFKPEKFGFPKYEGHSYALNHERQDRKNRDQQDHKYVRDPDDQNRKDG